MPLAIRDAALFGLTESSATLCFRVEDAAGPVAADVEVRLDGEVRARSAADGTRVVRIDGLEPGRPYALALEAEGAARCSRMATTARMPRASRRCTPMPPRSPTGAS